MVNLTNVGEVISTDVLIIGGGISGVVAAIKAKEYPVDVVIVDKATVGWAGQVPLAGGYIWMVAPDDDIDEWAEWQIKQGEYLNNQEWVYSMAQDWYSSIQEVADWGAPIQKDEKGKIKLIKRAYLGRYRFVHFEPHKMMVSLRAKARSKGVRIINKTEVVNLLKQDERIVGAVGFGVVDGSLNVFKSKAVIIANGGCNFKLQRLFVTSCGEGIAMAYRAGAEMRNAEFSINYNAAALKDYDTFTRGIPVHHFFNALGENVSNRYMSEGGENWLPLARGMVKEIMEGRGPIYMDLSKVPAKLRAQLRPAKVTPHDLWNIYDKIGVDPLSTKLEARPILTGKISAIKVDLNCQATVTGLWATGDASAQGSGWSGAIVTQGQFPGWAIAYAVVSGLRAGHSAGNFASETPQGDISFEEVAESKKEIFAPLAQREGITPGDIVYRIQEVAYPYKYNLFRRKERLEEALAKIKGVQQEIGRLWAKDSHDLVKCHEAKSMALCTEIGLRPALMRTESRGTHLREDHPNRDDFNWLKWIVLKQDGEKMSLTTEPVPINRYRFKP